MFLFESIPWYAALMGVTVLFGLIFVNEITRRSKKLSLFFYVAVPIIMTFTVWMKTSGPGTPMGYWFPWVKTYSALAGVLGFMALRYIKGLDKNKWMLMFPPFILAFNIAEAVYRDFQCFGYNGLVDGIFINGGAWNIMNGIAGILNIITLSGWVGIFISRDKSKDMVWPDQLWFWIIAYDLWNFAYVYNCIPDHSFYSGLILLLSCTIPAFFIKKGVWLQHRAQTLALWAMFSLTFPYFADTSKFAVQSSHNETALLVISGLALASNLAVFIYHFGRIVKTKKSPIKGEIYQDLNGYQEVVKANK
ncbi:DUF5692 family protein [Fusibacter bizertensis]|uniref:DUF5692 family protein n=1 Tax=Fusibacter bizertensis TaxID=1488331 RepID=A0ABT6NEH2_9FIRM|nr:DUF5692 family protein [Fusibacter bizertensis]MDH8678806.1 DUF5692 family protein [Fusibacter bizertensis]